MKKLILLNLIMVLFLLFGNGYIFSDETDDINDELSKLKNEIDLIKKDVEILKEKTKWFSLKIDGFVKQTYGVNFLSKPYYVIDEDAEKDKDKYGYGFDANHPITHGFDFENKVRFQMDLGNEIVASSTHSGDLGTKIEISLKLDSLGISEIKPEGSWYVVQAEDDQGNTQDIYFPKYESGDSNVYFGNIQLVLEEARISNIIGSGMFIRYKDVMEVHQYYGVSCMSEFFTLNHEYFNNGFVLDRDTSGENHKYASLFYSYDNEDYEGESKIAEAVKLWSNAMLHTDPDNDDYNQKPHGMSFGFDKALSEGKEGFHMYAEAGIATKDAFDPNYYLDDNFDFGFFIKAEPIMYSQKFKFHPKLALSFAFQTGTTKDWTWQWSTFAGGISLPLSIYLPSGQGDNFTIDFNYNMNIQIVNVNFANIFNFTPSITFLHGKMMFSLPILYSFKNSRLGGFLRYGNEAVETHSGIYYIDQIYDDHIFNMGFKMTFDSKQLFGDLFEVIFNNETYFAYNQQMDSRAYWHLRPETYPPAEIFFFNIFRNDFVFHDFGPKRLSFYYEVGIGYTRNARLVDSETEFKYEYDRETDTWKDTLNGEPMEWYRWYEGCVISIKSGVQLNIIKNLIVGIDYETPKIALNVPHPIGNQMSFSLIKFWSKLLF